MPFNLQLIHLSETDVFCNTFSLNVIPVECSFIFFFSFERDPGSHEYRIYTGLVNIPLSSGLVAVSVVSKTVPRTLEVT
jgi:hypothetical protein